MNTKDSSNIEIHQFNPNETINDIWESFYKHVLSNVPRDSVQYIESRKCFYTGVMAGISQYEQLLAWAVGNGQLVSMPDRIMRLEAEYMEFITEERKRK